MTEDELSTRHATALTTTSINNEQQRELSEHQRKSFVKASTKHAQQCNYERTVSVSKL